MPTVEQEVEEKREERELQHRLDVALAPLHKLCLGLGAGTAIALVVLAATLVHLARSPAEPYPLALLSQYFRGYTVSLAGAFIGAAWGFGVGFVLGWFFAFCRNLVVGTALFLFRTRAELAANKGFLDQI